MQEDPYFLKNNSPSKDENEQESVDVSFGKDKETPLKKVKDGVFLTESEDPYSSNYKNFMGHSIPGTA